MPRRQLGERRSPILSLSGETVWDGRMQFGREDLGAVAGDQDPTVAELMCVGPQALNCALELGLHIISAFHRDFDGRVWLPGDHSKQLLLV
jgi:hypothetical protein